MRVEIGPVSRTSTIAWLDYGAEVLRALSPTESTPIPTPALTTFAELIAEWRAVTTGDEPFHWIGDRPADQVEFLMKALYETGLVVEQGSGVPLRPAAADEFHFVLLEQVLLALEHEGRSNAEFVASLRNDWRAARPK